MLVQAGSYDLCNPSDPTTPVNYFPWTMAYPGPWVNPPSNDTITPGDVMYSSITMNTPGMFTTMLKDITKGWSFSVDTTDTGFTSLTRGDIIVEDEGGSSNLPLVPFNPNPIKFTNSQYSINGSTPAPLTQAPSLTCLNINRNGTILEQTSQISVGNFNETWKQQ